MTLVGVSLGAGLYLIRRPAPTLVPPPIAPVYQTWAAPAPRPAQPPTPADYSDARITPAEPGSEGVGDSLFGK